MTRQLTITAAEWASVQDGTLWLVREGSCSVCAIPGHLVGDPTCDQSALPWEFVQACAPCETCGGTREEVVTQNGMGETIHCHIYCTTCRIELVGVAWGEDDLGRPELTGTVTLGHAYALGQPLPIYSDSTMPHERPVEYLAAKLRSLSMGGNHTYSLTMYRRNAGGGYSVTPEFAQKAQQSVAHYGPPESLVGKWAQQLWVVGS